jgi:pimeloyl-ACP methyl ester carboxylesterase
LGKINVPFLAIWSNRDNISYSDNAKIISEKVKQSEIYIIKDTGHACYLDKLEEFKKELNRFLRKTG